MQPINKLDHAMVYLITRDMTATWLPLYARPQLNHIIQGGPSFGGILIAASGKSLRFN